MLILSIGEAAIDSLLISIVALVFEVIAKVFALFIELANAGTIDNSLYQQLIRNFYIVLTVVMLFAVAFGLLKYMIDPDDSKATGDASKIFKNLVTSIIILAVLPTIFNFAFGVQGAIINQNTIGKLFGNSYSKNNSSSVLQQGYRMSNDVFTAFFVPTDCENDDIQKCQEEEKAQGTLLLFSPSETSLSTTISKVNVSGNFHYYSDYAVNVAEGTISFNFIVLVIAGIFFAYVVFSFCLDMGMRAVKLVFYQIIAPIPVLLRIAPQDKLSGTFNSWLKIVVTCYLEVFIRLFILYFGVYLASAITTGKAFSSLFDGSTGLIAKAILILSIVAFMRQAPKLIGEIFGIDSSNMSLGIKDKLAAGGLFAAGAALGSAGTMMARGVVGTAKNIKNMGAGNRSFKKVAGAVGGGLKSSIGGGFSGFGHGLLAGRGAKSLADMKNATNQATDAIEEKRKKSEVYKSTHGGNTKGVIKGKLGDVAGTISAWSGWSAVDEGESNRYTDAANAFDAAHTQAEGVYKNKPGHNKLKEITTEKDSIVKRIQANIQELDHAEEYVNNLNTEITSLEGRKVEIQNNLNTNRANLSESQINQLESELVSLGNNISEKEAKRDGYLHMVGNKDQLESEYRTQLASATSELEVAKLEQSQHEAGEMKKKISVVMEATNAMVNAKTKYADLEGDIFNDKVYNTFLDSAKTQEERAANEALINKVKNNELISVADIAKANINGLEKFLDQVGINAKNVASDKRAAVAHAKALEDAKKSE